MLLLLKSSGPAASSAFETFTDTNGTTLQAHNSALWGAPIGNATSTIVGNTGRVVTTNSSLDDGGRAVMTGVTFPGQFEMSGTFSMVDVGVDQMAYIGAGSGAGSNENPANALVIIVTYSATAASSSITFAFKNPTFGLTSMSGALTRTLTGGVTYSYRLQYDPTGTGTFRGRVWTGTEPGAWDYTTSTLHTTSGGAFSNLQPYYTAGNGAVGGSPYGPRTLVLDDANVTTTPGVTVNLSGSGGMTTIATLQSATVPALSGSGTLATVGAQSSSAVATLTGSGGLSLNTEIRLMALGAGPIDSANSATWAMIPTGTEVGPTGMAISRMTTGPGPYQYFSTAANLLGNTLVKDEIVTVSVYVRSSIANYFVSFLVNDQFNDWPADTAQVKVEGFCGANTWTQLVGSFHLRKSWSPSDNFRLRYDGIQAPGATLDLSDPVITIQNPVSSVTQTINLTGSGTLAASAAPKPAVSTAFSGTGTLSTVSNTAYSATPALSGSGALTTSRTVTVTTGPALSGLGSLSSAATTNSAGTAALSGLGTLASTGTPAFTRIAALSGSGSLGTANAITVGQSANFARPGDILGDNWAGSVAVTKRNPDQYGMPSAAVATFTAMQYIGPGSPYTTLAAGDYDVVTWVISLDATSFTLRPAVEDTGDSAGSGTIDASTYPAFTVTPSWQRVVRTIRVGTAANVKPLWYAFNGDSGIGHPFAVSFEGIYQARTSLNPVTLSGLGTLGASGISYSAANSNLTGSGSLSTASNASASGAPALSGSGALSTTRTVATSASVVLSGLGTLASSAALSTPRTAALSGLGTLSTSSSSAYAGTPALTGSGTLSVAITPKPATALALSGSGTLAAPSGVGTISGAAALTGSGSLAVTTAISKAVALSGLGALTVPVRTPNVVAVPFGYSGTGGSGGLGYGDSGYGDTYGDPGTSSPTLDFTGSGNLATTLGSFPSLSGSGSLAAATAPRFTAALDLSGSGTLSATSSATSSISAALSGSGSIRVLPGMTRVNWALNPHALGATGTWSNQTPSGGVTSYNATAGPDGGSAFVVVVGSPSGQLRLRANHDAAWPVTPGTTVTVSYDVYVPESSRQAVIEIGFNLSPSGTNYISSPSVALSVGWNTVIATTTVPATSNGTIGLAQVIINPATAGQTYIATRALFENGYSNGAYFDGNSKTPDAISSSWNGTVGASSSTETVNSGTSSVSFGPALSGLGSLTAINTSSLSGASALSGTGALSILSSPRPRITTDLSGSGALAALGAGAGVGTPTLSGLGTLSSSVNTGVSGAATLSGSGALTTARTVSAPGSATLSGSGALFGSTGANYVATPILSGSGVLSSSAILSASTTVTLTGSGSLSSASTVGLAGTATLSGSGTLATATSFSGATTATLSGSGALSSTRTISATSTVALSGSGTLNTATAGAGSATPALSGLGAISTSTAPAPAVTVNLTGLGSLAASTVAAPTGTPTLSGSGSLSASTTPNAARSAALSGSGTLSSTANQISAGSATLSGSGTLTGVTAGSANGSAAFTGSGSLSISSNITYAASPSFSGSGTLLVAQSSGIAGSAILAGSGSLTSTRTFSVTKSIPLSGDGSLGFFGLVGGSSLAQFTGAGSLVVTPRIGYTGTANFSGTGSLAPMSSAWQSSGFGILYMYGNLLRVRGYIRDGGIILDDENTFRVAFGYQTVGIV